MKTLIIIALAAMFACDEIVIHAGQPHATVITPRDEQMFKQGAIYGSRIAVTNTWDVMVSCRTPHPLIAKSPDEIANEAFRQFIKNQP